MGRSADRLFASKNRGTRTAFAFAIRQGARDKNRHLAKRRAYRLDSFPRTIGECRFRKSGPEIRADKSAGLCRRMHERNLFVAEERIRHAGKSCCRTHRGVEADADYAQPRLEQFERPWKTLC